MNANKINDISKMDIYELLQIAALLLLPIGIYLAFSLDGIAESGYAQLLTQAAFLRSFGDLEIIKIVCLLFTIVITLAVYFALAKIVENRSVAFFIAMLFLLSRMVAPNIAFLLSPLSIVEVGLFVFGLLIFAFTNGKNKYYKYAALLPALLGLAIASQITNFSVGNLSITAATSAINVIGFVFPLAFLSLLTNELKKKEMLAAFVISIVIALFLPELALVMLLIFAAFGTIYLLKNPENMKAWILLILFVVLYIGTYTKADLFQIAIAALGCAVLMYFIFSLRVLATNSAMIFSLFFIMAVAASIAINELENNVPIAPNKELIELFKSANGLDGEFAMLELNNAFKFYSNKNANAVSAQQLLEETTVQIDADYLLLSTDSLYRYFGNRSFILKFVGIDEKAEEGRYNAVFANRVYALQVKMVYQQGNYSISTELQPQLIDLRTSYKKTIPFTKLKPFIASSSLIDKNNILINTESLDENTVLYRATTMCVVVFEGNSTKLVRVC